MNYKIFSFICLSTLVIVSKEVLVFNEEILVLFAFFLFIFLTFNLISNSISSELDSRLNKIKEDFVYYKSIQETTILRLISYHAKQEQLSKEMNIIFSIIHTCIKMIILSSSKLFVKSFGILVEDRLKKFFTNESKFNFILQNKINNELYSFLFFKYSKKDKAISRLLLKNSIFFLSSLSILVK